MLVMTRHKDGIDKVIACSSYEYSLFKYVKELPEHISHEFSKCVEQDGEKLYAVYDARGIHYCTYYVSKINLLT